jgi:hypothetical protein
MVVTFALSVPAIDAWPQASVPASDGVPDGIEAGPLVTRLVAATEQYDTVFRNLVADETKLIEVYNESGKVERRRQIVSDLLVYHSSREGTDASVEYRDVRAVDGKTVKQRRERALNLIASAGRADSLEEELAAINRETFSYEFNRHLAGFTINQAGPWIRRHGALQTPTVRREQFAGRDVVVLDFQQKGPVPGTPMPVPREFGTPEPVHRDRFWIDAETGQLWRHVWEVGFPHPDVAAPLVMLRLDSVYTPSRFGILVPERIVFDWLMHFSHPKNRPPAFGLSERTTFSYGAFRRFEVAGLMR